MLKPIGDKVIVKAKAEEEKTSGGIILPDTAKEKPQEGTVIAVGPGKLLGKTRQVWKYTHTGDIYQITTEQIDVKRIKKCGCGCKAPASCN